MLAAEMPTPAPGWPTRPVIELTMLTSRPSRIQTVPSPMMIFQCHADHGRRSRRDGILVRIVPVSTESLMGGTYPSRWPWQSAPAVSDETG